MTVTVPTCYCTHASQLHTPTGRMDDTTERGHGPCTVGTCPCDGCVERPER